MRFSRVLAAAFLASSSAIVFGACGDRGDERDDDRRPPHADSCSSYATCGTCTPVAGCGWCTYEDGSGSCASEPDHCRGSVFRWNWEPEGCSTPVDSGISTDARVTDGIPASDAPDAADAPASSDDAPTLSDAPTNLPGDASDATEASSADAPTTCTAPSRATVACVQTTGGTLCASGQYTLACHADGAGTPTPESTLGCKAVATGTSTTTFYCCPCPTS